MHHPATHSPHRFYQALSAESKKAKYYYIFKNFQTLVLTLTLTLS